MTLVAINLMDFLGFLESVNLERVKLMLLTIFCVSDDELKTELFLYV